MSGEKYPAKLVEKVAAAIADRYAQRRCAWRSRQQRILRPSGEAMTKDEVAKFESEDQAAADRLFEEIKAQPGFDPIKAQRLAASMVLDGQMGIGVSLRLMLRLLELQGAKP